MKAVFSNVKGIGVQQVNDGKTEMIAALKEIYSLIKKTKIY